MLYQDLPPTLVHAILSAEDKRFFEHGGFDFVRIFGAAWADLRHSSNHYQGASTITMQVSRDMFLTPRRDMKRKMSEIYISLLMEAEFTKEEIFSLYVNKIFLGQRAYGVGAATLRVAGANAWLARRAPTRAGDITDPEVTWRRADPRMASAVRRVPSRQSRSGRNNPRH